MRESYLQHCFLAYLTHKDFRAQTAGKWLPKEAMLDIFKDAMRASLERYGVHSGSKYDEFVESEVGNLLRDNVILLEGDQYAGGFFQIHEERRNEYVKEFFNNNEVALRVRTLGLLALQRAVRLIAEEDGILDALATEDEIADKAEESESATAPASDRVVSLSHNEISEFDERTSEIIEQVEALNGIEGEPGLREIVLGQLRAGRELVRAGAFRLYFLQITLIDTLMFLSKRYEKEAIGGLAGALAAALLKHLGAIT